MKRIPDFPNFMDKANYALQLLAEGKLNLSFKNNSGLEIEKIKLNNLRNNNFFKYNLLCFYYIFYQAFLGKLVPKDFDYFSIVSNSYALIYKY